MPDNSHFGELQVFFTTGVKHLIPGICEALNVEQEPPPVGLFPDGEPRLKSLKRVRGNDIFVVGTTEMPEDNTLELKVLVDAIVRASARRITLVIPYLSLLRQDAKRHEREAVSAFIRINELQNTAAERVLSVEVHNDKILAVFDPTKMIVDHLYGSLILIPYLRKKFTQQYVIASPDAGGTARAQYYADKTNRKKIIFFHKPRLVNGKLRGKPEMTSSSSIKGKVVIIVDDMMDTCGTMKEVTEVLKENGASKIYAAATHGLFSRPAIKRIAESPIDGVIITNTIYHSPRFFKPIEDKLTILPIEQLLARAITIIHEDKDSISDLYNVI